jgi:AcrR family transcriptional regulator
VRRVSAEVTPKRRGPYAKTPARRAEIIKHATEAFSQRGYSASSLREIAAAVGMTQPGLTHHFSSKEELLIAVLADKDRTYIREIAEESPDVVTRLQHVVERNSARFELMRLFTVLTGEAVNPEHPGHEFFRNRYERARHLFAELVREGQERKELDLGLDPEQTATVIVAVMEGLQLQWQMDDSVDMREPFEAFLDRLLAPRRRKRSR